MSPIFFCIVIAFCTFQNTLGEEKAKWLKVPNRRMEEGLEPFGKNNTGPEDKDAGRRRRNLLGFLTGGDKPKPTPGDSGKESTSDRIFGSGAEGFAAAIKGGENLNKKLDIDGSKFTSIVIDNRCKDVCEKATVRCVSQKKDTGYFEVGIADAFVLKFTIPAAKDLRWVCEVKDLKQGVRIIGDVFGGKAPKDGVNFYEIRDTGLIRLDDKTARIDARQPLANWPAVGAVEARAAESSVEKGATD